ncbi:hypothetical protein [Phreatobacter sp.]|uniref:hypothetical protein n=1 Tax=Phreatobacter sp. TaxID=1966341 RepID=UPI0022C2D2BF|nr:hypothetical protein [Phreatobacter sp.]MCZ8315981.1 hypothetical protein [Phreatobacter sp.]
MRFVWWGACAGAAVWSFVALMSYLVFDTIGTGMVSYGTVPGFTPEPFSFAWIAAAAHSLGIGAIALGWLFGIAVIFGGTAILHRIFGRRAAPAMRGRTSWGSSIPSGAPGATATPARDGRTR